MEDQHDAGHQKTNKRNESIVIRASFSIVTYYTSLQDLQRLVESIRACSFTYALTIVDNSASHKIQDFCSTHEIDYDNPGKNLGYGSGHNRAFRKYAGKTDYHIVINPDVYFEPHTFEPLFDFMDDYKDVGLCTPRVLYPDGNLQHLCKLVPSPADLFARRFIPAFMKGIISERIRQYEMRNFDYNQNLEVPILSGCCMVLKNRALEQCGMFDERYFLYLEDVDLSRRVAQKFSTVHYAQSSIVHHYQKSSYRKWSSLKLHLTSAVQYFNKWGWIWDKERKRLNARAKKANDDKRVS
ncbi:MAG TPA: glycosyl transferase family 2 [Cryomorphaceae bacterium]|nr:glycosyl transferase family 2 [Owenweeksia sp.]HAD97640.1 glycosyl transferase family 2 [Cryomorphaceae bacterium]HBF19970.1 glycosyl transferase family 2 [Cryomorphaceae bacterium]HCQ16647.1 glycosyl transferase family 2 [Cryomorphaceae bacterium]